MNEKVFISGSIAIKSLPQEVCKRLEKIMEKNMQVLVGDASGIDCLIQNFFKDKDYDNITVYSIYPEPRNISSRKFRIETINVSDDVKKERERQQFKDKQMSEDSDYSLIIWDGKSKGSFTNIIRALKLNKKIVVYLSKEQRFLPKDKCIIPEIEFIYRENVGYTTSEILEYFQKEGIKDFTSVKDLHQFLIKNNIIVKNEKKYEPHSSLEKAEVDKYFIKTQYKGKDTGLNYTNDLIDLIDKIIKTPDTDKYPPKQEYLFDN